MTGKKLPQLKEELHAQKVHLDASLTSMLAAQFPQLFEISRTLGTAAEQLGNLSEEIETHRIEAHEFGKRLSKRHAECQTLTNRRDEGVRETDTAQLLRRLVEALDNFEALVAAPPGAAGDDDGAPPPLGSTAARL